MDLRAALRRRYAARRSRALSTRELPLISALARAGRLALRREVPIELAPELPVPEPEPVAMRGAYGLSFTRPHACAPGRAHARHARA
jgi:hypothetical protein